MSRFFSDYLTISLGMSDIQTGGKLKKHNLLYDYMVSYTIGSVFSQRSNIRNRVYLEEKGKTEQYLLKQLTVTIKTG